MNGRPGGRPYVAVAVLALLVGDLKVAPTPYAAAQVVCNAVTRLELQQTGSLELQGFLADLGITNTLMTDALTGVRVDLEFRDETGAIVPGRFVTQVKQLTGVTSVDGQGVVLPNITGKATWLIIPARGAGGTTPAGARYTARAIVRYAIQGRPFTTPTWDAGFTVKPQPNLVITEAFRGKVEANTPFFLVVKVVNTGVGSATALSLTSLVPKVQDPFGGQVIPFEILASSVQGIPGANSLSLAFGDLASSATVVGEWTLQTTAPGTLTVAEATFRHTGPGGALTSPVERVEVDNLVARVLLNPTAFDRVADYIVDRNGDGEPDLLVTSEGPDLALTVASGTAAALPPGVASTTVLAPATSGWLLVRFVDPATGAAAVTEVTRTDGKHLDLRNVFVDDAQRLNLLDFAPDTTTVRSFVVTYDPLRFDRQPPRTTLRFGTPRFGADPVVISSTTALTFAAADDLSGAATTFIQVASGPAVALAGPLFLTTEGIQPLGFFSTDRAGNRESTQTVTVEVSTTLPVVAISSPVAGAEVSGLLDVRGTVRTAHPDKFTVEVLAVNGSTQVVTVSTLAVVDGGLGTWDTRGTPDGPATLRLTVRDVLGREVSTTTAVVVRNAGPQAIPDLRAGAGAGAGEIRLTWTASGDAGGAGAASRYEGRRATGPMIFEADWAAATVLTALPTPQVAGQGETATVTGLTVGTTVYFAVRAVGASGRLAGLSNSPGVAVLGAPPGTIPDLAATVTPAGVQLTWTAPTGGEGASAAVRYEGRRATGPVVAEADWAAALALAGLPGPQAAGQRETFVVTGLVPPTTQYFAVRGVDGRGRLGGVSNSPGVVLRRNPSAITDLIASAGEQVTLTWTAPGAEGTVGTAQAYRVRWATAPMLTDAAFAVATAAASGGVPQASGSRETRVLTGLLPRTTLYFAVEAENASGGVGPLSSSARARSGTLFAQQTLRGTQAGVLAWGDLDGDGRLDLAQVGFTGPALGDSLVRIYKNVMGPLVPFQDLEPFGVLGPAEWGDFDRDGDLDLVVGGLFPGQGRFLKVYRNDGGHFVVGQVLASLEAGSVSWADVDQDGDLDLAVSGLDFTGGIRNFTRVYRNDGGTLVALPDLNDINGSVAWGDFNQDGRMDLLVSGQRQNGSIQTVLLLNQGGALGPAQVVAEGVVGALAVADVDQDGDLDFALSGTAFPPERLITRVYLNIGAGTFEPGQTFEGGDGSALAWGDVDQDGVPDLVVTGLKHAPDGVARAFARLYHNQGGTLVEDQVLSGFDRPSVAFADVDRDGDLDLVIGGRDINDVSATRLYANAHADFGLRNSTPVAPTQLSATFSTDTLRLTLSWNDGTDLETTNPTGLYYALRIGTHPGGNERVSGEYGSPLLGNYLRPRTPAGFRRVLQDLASDATYYWAVRTIDGGLAASPESVEQIVNTHVPPAAVTDLEARFTTQPGAVELVWTAPGDDGTVNPIVGGRYWILYDKQLPLATETLLFSTNTTPGARESRVVTGLTQGTTYYFVLRTGDEVPNFSADSNLAMRVAPRLVTSAETVLVAGVPEPVVSFVADATTMTVTVVASTGAVGTVALATAGASGIAVVSNLYQVVADTFSAPAVLVFRYDPFNLPPLVQESELRIYQFNTAAGFWEPVPDQTVDLVNHLIVVRLPVLKSVFAVFGPDRTPPATITDLVAVPGGQVTLTWTAPGDDGAVGTARSYRIRWSSQPIDDAAAFAAARVADPGPPPQVAGTPEARVLTGLLPRTTLYFAVVAVDENDNAASVSNRAVARANSFVLVQRLPALTTGALAWGDVDGDGRVDLALAGNTPAGGALLQVYRSTGAGVALWQDLDAAGGRVPAVVWEDVDHDGDLDLVVSDAAPDGTGRTRVFRNDGGRLVETARVHATVARGPAVADADVDQDGVADRLVDQGGVQVFHNAAGTFVTDQTVPGGGAGALVAADWEGDGDAEFVVAGPSGTLLYRNLEADLGRVNAGPSPPSTFTSTYDPSRAVLTLRWTDGQDRETSAAALTYALRVGTSPTGHERVSGAFGTPLRGNVLGGRTTEGVTAFELADVLPDSRVFWAVRTVDAGLRAGAESLTQAATTFVAPAPITDLAIRRGPNPGEASLTWSSPGDDGTVGTLVGVFEVRRATGPVLVEVVRLSTTAAPGSAQSFRFAVLAEGVAHRIEVVAEDDIRNRTGSNAVALRTVTSVSVTEIGGPPAVTVQADEPMTIVAADTTTPVGAASVQAAARQGQAVVGTIFDVGPASATFTPAAFWTLRYDPARLLAGTTEAEVRMAQYEAVQDTWVTVADQQTDVGAKTITARTETLTGLVAVLAPIPDRTPPVTTLRVVGARVLAAGTTFLTPTASVVLDATDVPKPPEMFASGVARTEVGVDTPTLRLFTTAFTLAEGLRSVQFRSTDKAGNVESLQAVTLGVDGTAPASTFTAAPALVRGLYASTGTALTWAATDLAAGSPPVAVGVARLTLMLSQSTFTVAVSTTLTLAEGFYSSIFVSEDRLGNQDVTRTVDLRVDGTPPRTTLVPSAAFYVDGSGSRFAPPATVYRLEATDPDLAGTVLPGSGVTETRYRIDVGTWTVWVGTPIVLTEGVRTIEWFSTDAVGNAEIIQTLTIRVDGTAPQSTLTIGSPTDFPRSAPVFAAHVFPLVSSGTALTVTATDPVVAQVASGVRAVQTRITLLGTPTGAFTVTAGSTAVRQVTGADGDYTVEFFAADQVTNTEPVQRTTVTVDNTAPLARLLSPAPENTGVCQVLGGTIPVVVTLSDRSFATARLEVASGLNATTGFVSLAVATGPVTNTALVAWVTTGRSGWQTLRLTAEDLVQHVTVTTAAVFVGDPALTQTLGATFKKSEKDDLDDLDHPEGVAIAPDGTRWVADSENNRLVAFTTAGALLRTVTGFHEPQGIAVLSDNSALWVADRNNSRLVKLTPTGTILQTVGRTNAKGKPQAGSAPGQFNHPAQVAVDSQGRVYVADRNNHRWQRLNADGTADLVIPLPGPEPFGIAVTTDATRVYVSEEESGQVFVYAVSDTTATPSGTLGGGPGTFKKPQGLATTRQNHVYVAERNANQVRKYDRFGSLVLVFGTQPGPKQEEGDDDEKGKKMAADPLRLFKPTALAVGPGGELAVAVRNDDGVKIFSAPAMTSPRVGAASSPPAAAPERPAVDLSVLGPPHDFAIGPNPARAGAPVTIFYVSGWSNQESECRVYTAAGELVCAAEGSEATPQAVAWGAPGYAPGRYAVAWSGANQLGQPVASGVYLIQLKVRNPDTGEVVPTLKKVLVIR